MNIALYSSHDDPSGRALVGIGSFILFHKGSEPRNSLFHDPGRLYYLGEKHFTLSEKVSHDRHAIHERAFNDLQWTAILLAGLLSVRVDEFGNALQQGIFETFFYRGFSPSKIDLLFFSFFSYEIFSN